MAITISGSGITSANIADGTIVSGDIAAGAVSSSKIASGVLPTKANSDPTISSNPASVGDEWINRVTGEKFICTDNTVNANVWKNQRRTSGDVEPRDYWYGDRGVYTGNRSKNSSSKDMQYFDITTTGNTAMFGNLTAKREYQGVSNATRGVILGGADGSVAGNTMDYITIATLGDATDFGDSVAANRNASGISNGSRGIRAGGYNNAYLSDMDYITISTTGNATDFGDLLTTHFTNGAVSNLVRGVVCSLGVSYQMEYITIATTGNALDFGDLNGNITHGQGRTGVEDETRGVFGGGRSPMSSSMEYITIATTGNSTAYADLTTERRFANTVTNGTRGVFAGGDRYGMPTDSGPSNIMEYITIATTNNSTDFGDLTGERWVGGGISG